MKKIKFKFKALLPTLDEKEEDRWQNNPIAQLLLFMPATFISSILIIPCLILSLPLTILPAKFQKNGMQFLLRVQNTISLSFWYFVGKWLFSDDEQMPFYFDTILVLIGVYFGFKKTINKNVNETLEKSGFI
jgi:hypothetical protein|tara:strand:+ start:796 stop:1191 length:396 start_codon:yes stop_codon:yes gene_type:complete